MSTAGTRREARERALSLLYEAEARDIGLDELLEGLPVEPVPYVIALVRGVEGDREAIDEAISRHSHDWRVERMPAVDRALLRVAAYELLHEPEVPATAVLAEAVELAGDFSTERSSRFVNGVLSALAQEVRSGETRQDGEAE